MVEFMVRLLETGTEALENPAATKAQIVKAIKAMQNSLNYGEQVWLPYEVVFDALIPEECQILIGEINT